MAVPLCCKIGATDGFRWFVSILDFLYINQVLITPHSFFVFYKCIFSNVIYFHVAECTAGFSIPDFISVNTVKGVMDFYLHRC